MQSKIYQSLAFDKIRGALAGHTLTIAGKGLALQVEPMKSREAIEDTLCQVDEVKALYELALALPLVGLEDLSAALKRLAIDGVLSGKELAGIGQVLSMASQFSQFFDKLESQEVRVPHLREIVDQLSSLPQLNKRLREAIAPDGSVYDEASRELARIRHAIKREEAHIRISLDQIMKSKKQDYLSDHLITIRNDRYVLPVKQEYRRAFGGVVHDQSASGQTVYIEPQSVMEANNKVQSLKTEEKVEIERILAELSAALAPHCVEIQSNYRLIGQLDFIQAKWRLAQAMKAHRPQLAEHNGEVALVDAVHPFLDARTAVANTIRWEAPYRMLIITGPNTGGKTITLKTTGLLQLMGQAGLYITASEESRLGIFDEIYADIGDEQSIEANLSTFSGHMMNMIHILEEVDDRSLVLMDELGSGTDPKEGAALAMAILNRLDLLHCTVLATTHYPELKAYAFNHPQAMNASVAFDEEKLRPTYRLLIGQPGRSNALDISERLGLAKGIVEEARTYAGEENQSLNEMLDALNKERQSYENKQEHLSDQVKEAEDLLRDVKKVYHSLQSQKENYLHQAQKEAQAFLEETQEKADKLLAEIRQWKKEGRASQLKEHQLIDQKKAIQDLTPEQEQLQHNKVLNRAKRQKKAKEEWQVGDQVKVFPYGQIGTLVEKREDHTWVVQMGMLKMALPEQDLERLKPAKVANQKKSATTLKAPRAKRVKSTLDLRGMRYEEALRALDSYIDQALLANLPQVTIIHGFGTGVIREAVQKYLRQNPRVLSFSYAPHNLGGQGATIAKFTEE